VTFLPAVEYAHVVKPKAFCAGHEARLNATERGIVNAFARVLAVPLVFVAAKYRHQCLLVFDADLGIVEIRVNADATLLEPSDRRHDLDHVATQAALLGHHEVLEQARLSGSDHLLAAVEFRVRGAAHAIVIPDEDRIEFPAFAVDVLLRVVALTFYALGRARRSGLAFVRQAPVVCGDHRAPPER
jgi:hypothetical protein